MQPRWRRCLTSADNYLGDALGKEYVKVAFTPEAKRKALEMIDAAAGAVELAIGLVGMMANAYGAGTHGEAGRGDARFA